LYTEASSENIFICSGSCALPAGGILALSYRKGTPPPSSIIILCKTHYPLNKRCRSVSPGFAGMNRRQGMPLAGESLLADVQSYFIPDLESNSSSYTFRVIVGEFGEQISRLPRASQ